MNIPTVSLLGTVPSMGQPSRERETERDRERWGRVLGTLHEEGAPASLHGRVSNPSRPVPLWGQHSWLWPWQEVADVQCFRSLEPRSWVLWKGQILESLWCWWWCNTLSCYRTELCSCGVGSLCIRPKACKQSVHKLTWLESVRKNTSFISALTLCSPRAALSVRTITKVLKHADGYRRPRLPMPCSPVNWVVLRSTLVP